MLEVKVGATVTFVIAGHSALNGAPIPTGSKVVITSNTPAVATIADVPDLTADSATITAAVTILGPGTTDGHVTVTTPDGTVMEATDTLVVDQPQPGLLRVTAAFTAA